MRPLSAPRTAERAAVWLAAAVLLCTLLTRWYAAPRDPWEWDEILFLHGTVEYNPFKHHPHPPGYPVYMALAKVLDALIGEPVLSLALLSLLSSLLCVPLLAWAVRPLFAGDRFACWLTAGVYAVFPVTWFYSGRLFSENPAQVFLILACGGWLRGMLGSSEPQDRVHVRPLAVRWSVVAAWWWTGWLMGIRPQYAPLVAVLMLPLLVVSLRQRRWREVLIGLAVGAAVCAVWLVGMISVMGGLTGFLFLQQDKLNYLQGNEWRLYFHGLPGFELRDYLRAMTEPLYHRAFASNKGFGVVALLSIIGTVALARRSALAALTWSVAFACYALMVTFAMIPDDLRYFYPLSLGLAPLLGAAIIAGSSLLRRPEQRRLAQVVGLVLLAGLFGRKAWPASLYFHQQPSLIVQTLREGARLAKERDVPFVIHDSLKFHATWYLHPSEYLIGSGPWEPLLASFDRNAAVAVLIDQECRRLADEVTTIGKVTSKPAVRLSRSRYYELCLYDVEDWSFRQRSRYFHHDEPLLADANWCVAGCGEFGLVSGQRGVLISGASQVWQVPSPRFQLVLGITVATPTTVRLLLDGREFEAPQKLPAGTHAVQLRRYDPPAAEQRSAELTVVLDPPPAMQDGANVNWLVSF